MAARGDPMAPPSLEINPIPSMYDRYIYLHLVDFYLVGGFKYFLFSPLLGEMIQFD